MIGFLFNLDNSNTTIRKFSFVAVRSEIYCGPRKSHGENVDLCVTEKTLLRSASFHVSVLPGLYVGRGPDAEKRALRDRRTRPFTVTSAGKYHVSPPPSQLPRKQRMISLTESLGKRFA